MNNLKEMINTVVCGDALETVKTFPDESIDSVITSPPYYQLRDYGWTGQWGLEKTYQEYLDKLITLMSELKRVLKPTGTVWINLGDTYNGNKYGNHDPKLNESIKVESKVKKEIQSMPNKSLMLIPHRFAIRCIDELGLILRNDIIWAKRNGMPESVTNRFSKKHEFIFFFVKQRKYYFDLDGVRERIITNEKRDERIVYNSNKGDKTNKTNTFIPPNPKGKNPGDVSDFWDIPTQPSSEKHYATYNFKLINKPIIAGCPKGGIILDPFCGTGTTLVRAIQLGRQGIGIDGNPEYCEIAQKRIEKELAQLKLSI